MIDLMYLGIVARLKAMADSSGASVIKTFDLWNEQVDFIEEEDPFETPAVFIEFLPIEWKGPSSLLQQADASFKLHIITDYQGSAKDGSSLQGESLERFRISKDITKILTGLTIKDGGSVMTQVRRTGSAPNHNHGEIIEDIDIYSCKLIDKL